MVVMANDAKERRAETLRLQIRAFERQEKILRAREELVPFVELMMPDQNDPDDVSRSRYRANLSHQVIAHALQEVEARRLLRVIFVMPPRHGKSQLISRMFPPWLMGRDPYRHVMFATYNQPFAEDFGRTVRDIMRSPAYAQVYPLCRLAEGSQAAEMLRTVEGGQLSFVGRGGSSTGRGADYLILDDPIKDKAEAESPTIRDACWDWFNATMSSRLMTHDGAIIIVMTRWHEDDLVGRLTDPANKHYNADEAAQWKIVHIPAIAGDDDSLGRAPGEALWPERFGLPYLEAFRRRDPVSFEALYQGRPTPPDGELFRGDDIVTYREAPKRLTYFGASDFAVTVKQTSDLTCHLVGGVDEDRNIWLVDCCWKRMRSRESAAAMVAMMKRWETVRWWAESGQIKEAMDPLIREEMEKQNVVTSLVKSPVDGDKVKRAQAAIGLTEWRRIRFPAGAWWYVPARTELLKFNKGAHDDFVDALAHLARGIRKMYSINGKAGEEDAPKGPPVGSGAWVVWASRQQEKARLASQTRSMR